MSIVTDYLKANLIQLRSDMVERMLGGVPGDYVEYREMVGSFKMLNHVLQEIEDSVAAIAQKDLE